MGKKATTDKKAAPAKRAAKPLAAKRPATVKKSATPAKPAVPKAAAKSPGFTTDDIALRAYFIAEKRRQNGLPGDEHADWLEAERQLLAEKGSPKKARRTKAAAN